MSRNKRFILNIMSDALMITGVSMLPSLVLSMIFDESEATRAIGIAVAIFFATGFYGRNASGRIEAQVRPRIWYMTTFFTWLLLILLTAPVFYFGMKGCSMTDALIESSAGWTATGMGALDSASMPRSLLLARATINWLGGVGIIMTILSLVPTRQFLGYGLVSTEFPGPSFLKSGDPFRKGYRNVVLVYILLAMMQFILLIVAGMPEFDSLLTALSNTSTAGLRHLSNGVVIGLEWPLKAIITLFAFLGSVNCTLFLLVMSRRFRAIRQHSEIKAYICKLLVASLVIAAYIAAFKPDARRMSTFGEVLMQVISFVSTSGYIITDVSAWPQFCIILVTLMVFIGACAVSTGGGIKIARLIIAFKTVSHSIYRHIHPSSVRTLTFNKRPMSNDQIVRANLFIVLFMSVWLGGALLLTFDEMSLAQALNYSQAMITNTGNAIGDLGMPLTVGGYSPFTKIVMCLLMIAGRLEIYPFIMIFLRNFWKSDSAV